jgi:small-conductance mechanosensitive channel
MIGYGESSINFRLQVWLRVENAIAVPSDLHLALIDRLRAAGVEVPVVRRERHEKGNTE